MWPNPQETVDLVKFKEKIFNGKLHFWPVCTNYDEKMCPCFDLFLTVVNWKLKGPKSTTKERIKDNVSNISQDTNLAH